MIVAVFVLYALAYNQPPVLLGELKSFSIVVFRRKTLGEAKCV